MENTPWNQRKNGGRVHAWNQIKNGEYTPGIRGRMDSTRLESEEEWAESTRLESEK